MSKLARQNRIVTLEGFIIDGDTQTPAHPDLIALCVDVWECKQRGDDLKGSLDELKAEVLEGFDGLSPSAAILIPGVCRISLKRGAVKWSIKNVDAVRELLGDRFDDLIETKTSHVPAVKLMGMLTDGDDPLGKKLRKHVKKTVGDPTVQVVAA